MHHIGAKVVVAFQLLPFKVGLHDSLVRKEDLTHPPIVSPFHDVFISHQRVCPSQPNHRFRPGLHWVIDQSHRCSPFLRNDVNLSVGVADGFSIDLGAIRHEDRSLPIHVVNGQDPILPDGDGRPGLWVFSHRYTDFLGFIIDHVAFDLADPFDPFVVDSLPDPFPPVHLGHVPHRAVDVHVPIHKVPDYRAISGDDPGLLFIGG
mmetsp:Transcript_30767/g.30255  ORF Transcript_30767/g.30255 Transcript_30767/m.30255 type:complete len:205 (-) Transcript_30767:40-654(-)